MTECQFYNQLDPGAINIKKLRNESRKMVLNQAKDQAAKIEETFLGSHDKLNCDQLLNMHHIQNQLDKKQRETFYKKLEHLI